MPELALRLASDIAVLTVRVPEESAYDLLTVVEAALKEREQSR